MPHVLEKSGRISNTPFTFDTSIFANYVGASDATVGMGFLGNNGAAFECVNGPMPPFSTVMNAQQNTVDISMEDIAASAGGFPADGHVKLGFGVIVVGGADPENVAVQGFVVNSHTGPFDLSVFGFDPVPISADAAVQRTYVIPHVLETSGRLSSVNTNPLYDTDISLLYTGGLGDLPDGATGACAVEITLGGVTMPPVMLGSLQGMNRKQSIRVDDLLLSAGLPPDFDGPISFDVTGDAWAFASTAFVQHGLDVDNLDSQSYFMNAAVPEPTVLTALSAIGALALTRRRQAK